MGNDKAIRYDCDETGVIKEHQIESFSMFLTATPYPLLYKKYLPNFKKHPLNIYGLPFHKEPTKIYQGVDREGVVPIDRLGEYFSDELFKTEEDVLRFLTNNRRKENLEVLWIRTYGDKTVAPHDYTFLGFDISYEPSFHGAFSIICDCLFICRWHGCDSEGVLFTQDFDKLNDHGLFSQFEDAHEYMVRYLNQDWSERGSYHMLEVYGKQ